MPSEFKKRYGTLNIRYSFISTYPVSKHDEINEYSLVLSTHLACLLYGGAWSGTGLGDVILRINGASKSSAASEGSGEYTTRGLSCSKKDTFTLDGTLTQSDL